MPCKKMLIQVFCENYQKLVWQAIGMVGNKEDALDVLQDVALAILNIDDDQEISAPITYLRMSIKNTALNYHRRGKWSVPTDPEILTEKQAASDVGTTQDYVELKDSLEELLGSFQPPLRTAFIMRYVESYTLEEIAQDLNIRPNTLAQSFKRMRTKITKSAASILLLLPVLPAVFMDFGSFDKGQQEQWQKHFKLLRENPHILDHAYVLRRSEIERIYNSGFPSLREFIAQTKARYTQLPREAWAEFDAALAAVEAKQKDKHAPMRRKNTIGQILRHRGLAIACAVLILAVTFFACLPSGRALAKEIFSIVVHIIEDRIHFGKANPSYQDDTQGNGVVVLAEPTQPDEQPATASYPSFLEFHKQTGLVPLIIDSDKCKPVSIQLSKSSDTGSTLETQYLYDTKLKVGIIQRWDSKADLSVQSKDSSFQQRTILGDKILYYSIDAADKSFNGYAVLDDSMLMIGAQSGVDMDSILNLLKAYQ